MNTPEEKQNENKDKEKPFHIVVNGQGKTWPKEQIGFFEVISLDPDLPKPGPNIEYTITYKNAVAPKHSGTMSQGDIVTIKNGTIFNARYTDKS
jgi:hypothetical protein